MDRDSKKINFEAGKLSGFAVQRIQASLPFEIEVNSVGFFEISIGEGGDRSEVSIGLTPRHFPLAKLPGRTKKFLSFGYSSPGDILAQKKVVKTNLPFRPTHSVGCGVDFLRKQVFFTRNEKIEHVFEAVEPQAWFATVGFERESTSVKFNFGPKGFSYDIADYLRQNEKRYKKMLNKEKDFKDINNAVLNYFLFNCYPKSLEVFQSMNMSNSFAAKLVMNHSAKLETDILVETDPKKTEKARRSSITLAKSEIESSSVPRRSSLLRGDQTSGKDNEEVLKNFNYRCKIKSAIIEGRLLEAYSLTNELLQSSVPSALTHQLDFLQFYEKFISNPAEAITWVSKAKISEEFIYRQAPVCQEHQVRVSDLVKEVLMEPNNKILVSKLALQRQSTFEIVNQIILKASGYLSRDSIDILNFQEEFVERFVKNRFSAMVED